MRSLTEQIASFASAPYAYAYPPTRSYRALAPGTIVAPHFTPDLNVYVHVPFCDQKCSFCGYLVTVDRTRDVRESYVQAVVAEIRSRATTLAAHRITSVNFGGGTPSLLSSDQLLRILGAIRAANPATRVTAGEISIEATPESIASGTIGDLVAGGFTRVSVGIQSLDDAEINRSHRHNLARHSVAAIRALQDCGVPNVCCDLMYGLQGQTLTSWQRSVDDLIELLPDTIELYATVTIPGTAYARGDGPRLSPPEMRTAYHLSREALLAAGYAQDCHLRFVRPGRGGYLQQEHVFAGQSLIGFGVGARSYGIDAHTRNVNGGGNGRTALSEYLRRIAAGEPPVESAVTLDRDQQIRRWLVYQLEHLDADAFHHRFGDELNDSIGPLLSELRALGLAETTGPLTRLTADGLAARDTIATHLFSPEVRAAEMAHWRYA